MMATTGSDKLAADIPACTNPANEALARFTREAQRMDYTDEETHTVARGTLADMIEGYRHKGTITPEHAAWVAGTFTNKGMRDMLMASLATPSYDTGTVSALMLGQKSPEDWEFFMTGADALYTALEFIPTEHRADLLVGIGWTRWIDGKGTEALKFISLALDSQPGHRLSELLSRLILSGEVALSASIKH